MQAFITGPNGVGMTGISPLGSFSDSSIEATGINASGQVVVSVSLSGDSSALITGPNGAGMRALGGLDGYANDYASGINDAGQVAGDSSSPHGYNPAHAFITGLNGVGVRNLGTLGGDSSWSTGINNAGQVVGDSYTADGQIHAFITGANGGGMRDLGTLGGDSSEASINTAGQLVGGDSSEAHGINAAGQVVGESPTAAGHEHAFITGPNGVGMTDLNSLVHLPAGVVLENAVAINNAGQVIAEATTVPAIPEPQSYALLLAGLVLTGVMARRKQKADALEGALDL